MSSEVKRYEVWRADAELPDETMVVLASDYAALEAECERLKSAVEHNKYCASVANDLADALAAELAAIKGQEVE